MTKVVITGSEGFIGSYLVAEALERGYEVIGIDNFSKYGPKEHGFHSNPNYTLIKGDASNVALLRKHFEGASHVIAGAALIGGISYFHTYAYDLLSKNERIIAATCDAALEVFNKGILRKVTYLSSSMVYESTNSWPSKEGDQFLCPPPRSSYGFQKLAVEYFAKAAWDQYRLPFTILRPFNCVGIGEKRALGDREVLSGNIRLAMSHVVPDLVQKVIKGQDPLLILGTGSQIRCYTYGGDLAKGIIDSLENPRAMNEDFNISHSKPTSVIELAELIWKKIHGQNKPFRFLLEPGFEHDVERRIPDVTKAKMLLNFEAKTDLNQMLDEVIPWVRTMCEKGEI
jgi:nucleoside-diphosphate-sugar epimerase